MSSQIEKLKCSSRFNFLTVKVEINSLAAKKFKIIIEVILNFFTAQYESSFIFNRTRLLD